MSVVVGTAGHIDHGKTTLLRALTGIDADRLPEERRRGMTIDVGYAHVTLPDGRVVDFVDVPGHDRLVGNMLAGAGEIDAAMVVVAADDGPNAQTLEHLELLDALGVRDALIAITKADLVGDAIRLHQVREAIDALLGRTALAGAPVVVVSAVTGAGLDDLRAALAALADAVEGRGGARTGGSPRLAIDRVFAVKGRGTVVTGSLRGGAIRPGSMLRVVPGSAAVRVREVQVRGAVEDEAGPGRAALLVGGVEPEALERGRVVTGDAAVVATSRLLVALRQAAALRPDAPPPRTPEDRERLRLHLGTDQVEALVIRGPREAIVLADGSSVALLRLEREIAAAVGDRFALRRPSPGSTAGGGVVLDPAPPRGVSRRRLTPARAEALRATLAGTAGRAQTLGSAHARSVSTPADAATLDLHGALDRPGEAPRLAPDVAAALAARALELVAAHHAGDPASPGLPLATLRPAVAIAARRLATLGRAAADAVASSTVDSLVADGRLVRDGDLVRDPARAGGLPPDVRAAMDRLEAALATATPPALSDAARAAGCPPAGVRALDAEGRIVRLEDDLAWATPTYRDLVKRALAMAAAAPLTPAAFRDATGSSRRYVLVILEDLDRRELLRRTDAGHVLGARTLARMAERHARAASHAPRPARLP